MFIDGINAKVAKIGNRKKAKQYRTNLADSIVHLLRSPGLCDGLSTGAIKTYNEKYTIKEMEAKYKKLVKSL